MFVQMQSLLLPFLDLVTALNDQLKKLEIVNEVNVLINMTLGLNAIKCILNHILKNPVNVHIF